MSASASETATAPTIQNGVSLAEGTELPRFKLPLVNKDALVGELNGKKSFGPGQWAGKNPKDPKELVLVSFFATYCAPCKAEMPELARLYTTYKDQGLGIVLVSIDRGAEKRTELTELGEKSSVTFPIVHDRFQVVARRFKAETLPYLLMVRTDGTIERVHLGYAEGFGEQLENEVRASLGLEPLVKKKKRKRKRRRKKKRK